LQVIAMATRTEGEEKTTEREHAEQGSQQSHSTRKLATLKLDTCKQLFLTECSLRRVRH
jgi:hypothetical protein